MAFFLFLFFLLHCEKRFWSVPLLVVEEDHKELAVCPYPAAQNAQKVDHCISRQS